MRSPLIAGIAASAGTFVAMGAATFVVSGVALTVAKRVIQQKKVGSSPTNTPQSSPARTN